ncbi:hypothetical protein T4B_5062 [Trichinella pseudospiralis]|uniref:Uncharacterized protein n=2 Tax=Trichinella pseudospiralis TaxID=6337 RepID=A0A0V1EZQ9_TRIPS|nr:hypothetical protein T4A_5836 [Trichinella pseudospiralis]KRY91297.1 hypothetical protein T4D_9829 [Trichinella pseudospiralis]KRZ32405.1 hypothetical protein T4B_5062 [Trichinella pseudospiralis]KRZ45581.1 hypothetical protein T4C_3453 [Trichinella pseudospiralis]
MVPEDRSEQTIQTVNYRLDSYTPDLVYRSVSLILPQDPLC